MEPYRSQCEGCRNLVPCWEDDWFHWVPYTLEEGGRPPCWEGALGEPERVQMQLSFSTRNNSFVDGETPCFT